MKTTTTAAAAGAAALDDLRAALDARPAQATGWAAARQQGDETAAILVALDAERDIFAGALLQPLLGRALLPRADAVKVAGEPAVRLAEELERLGEFRAGNQWTPGRALSANQADALRRMLLAVVTDPRLVLVRLAEQLRRMRRSRDLDEGARLQLAWETREIYAPLASRLGIWQLKWELEDLSFRWLEPAEYRRIAGWLNESRIDRERYIETVIGEIAAELARAGIAAEVLGRPKHIYSIWRKMHRKELSLRAGVRRARRAHHHRLRGGLLRRARSRARPLALHPGRVRRLHRDAQGQSLPFPAHGGARTRVRAGRDPDPHA